MPLWYIKTTDKGCISNLHEKSNYKCLKLIYLRDVVNYDLLTSLLNLTSKEHFITNKINLVEIKDQIEFANSLKVCVEGFNKQMYCLQHCQLIIIKVTADSEIKPCITSVNNLVRAELNEVCLLCITTYNQAVDLLLKLVALICIIANEVLRKPGTAKFVLDQKKADHFLFTLAGNNMNTIHSY